MLEPGQTEARQQRETEARQQLSNAIDQITERVGFAGKYALKPSQNQEVGVHLSGPRLQRESLDPYILELLDKYYPNRSVAPQGIIVGKSYVLVRTKHDPKTNTDIETIGAGFVVADPISEVVRDNALYLYPERTPMQVGVREWQIGAFKRDGFAADFTFNSESLKPEVISAIAAMVEPPKIRQIIRNGDEIEGLQRLVNLMPTLQVVAREIFH